MIFAVLVGPIVAVFITLWSQSRKDKKAAKRQLFTTLMAQRKSLIISQEVAGALNTIDVVFADNQAVVNLWHKYYTLLSQPPGQERDHTWLELLAAMAEDLDYTQLKQTDLDKFYIPQGHVDRIDFEREASAEWLRVLKNTHRFLVEKRTDEVVETIPFTPPKSE